MGRSTLSAKTSKRPRDLNQWAKHMVDLATGEASDKELTPVNEFARSGGLKGGKARAEALSPERRSEIARLAAQTRHGNRSQE